MTTTQARPTARTRLDPWERRAKESDVAYEAFVVYRDLGAARSTAKVARKLGKSKTLMDRWSSEHAWVVRASSYDSHIDREHLLRLRDMRRKAAVRNAKVARKTMRLLEEVVDSAALNPDLVKLSDMAALARVALAAEESALKSIEAPASRGTSSSGSSSDGAVDAGTISGMTDEERAARLAMLVREAGERMHEHEEAVASLHGDDLDDDDDDEE